MNKLQMLVLERRKLESKRMCFFLNIKMLFCQFYIAFYDSNGYGKASPCCCDFRSLLQNTC